MYFDSVGGRYERLPTKPPVHHAKKTKSNKEGKKGRSERRPKVGNGGCGCEFCRHRNWR